MYKILNNLKGVVFRLNLLIQSDTAPFKFLLIIYSKQPFIIFSFFLQNKTANNITNKQNAAYIQNN